MKRLLLTPKAKTDLNGIWDFSDLQWGAAQAEKYIRELWQAMQSLAADSSASSEITAVRNGYRKITSGSHVIFFRNTSDTLEVVRILHQKMDFDRHL